jgi:WD40 repeat protein
MVGHPKDHGAYRFITVDCSPTGRVLASGHFGGAVRLWEVRSGRLLKELVGHSDFVASVTFSPDEKQVASGGQDRTVRVWDCDSGKQLMCFKGHRDTVWPLSFSPDGKQLASGGVDGLVNIWDVRGGKRLRQWSQGSPVRAAVFSPNGTSIITGTADHTIRVWDVKSGRELYRLKEAHCPLTILPGTATIAYLAEGLEGRFRICLWDLASKKCVREFPVSGNVPLVLAASYDGRFLAGMGRQHDYQMVLWETLTGKEVLSLKRRPVSTLATSLRFAPDGRSLVSCDGLLQATVWDLSRCGAASQDGKTERPRLLHDLWEKLGGEDAPASYRAMWQLVTAPDDAVQLFRNRLPRARKIDPANAKLLISDLDSNRYHSRRRAFERLRALGESADQLLRKYLVTKTCSLEQRRAINTLLAGIALDVRRKSRALAVLEYSKTQAVREYLRHLASGDPDEFLTKEAKAALRRLGDRIAR